MAEQSIYVHKNLQGNDIYNIANVAIGNPSVLPNTRLYIIGATDDATTKSIAITNNSGVAILQVMNSGSLQVGKAYNSGYDNTNFIDLISPSAFSVLQRLTIGFDSRIYLNYHPALSVAGPVNHIGPSAQYYPNGSYGRIEVNLYDITKNFGWIWDNPSGTTYIYSIIKTDNSSRVFSVDYATGNVGVNTGNLNAPSAKLQVIGSDAAGGYGLQVRNISNQPTLYVKNNGFVGIGVDASYPLYVLNSSAATGVTDVAVFDNGAISNVLVRGSSASSITLADSSGSGNYAQLRADIYYANLYLNYNNNGGVTFQLSGVPKLQIASVGNSYNQITSYLPMLIHNGTNYSMIWNTNGWVSVGNAYASCRFDVISPAADAGNSNIVRFNNATLGNIAEFRNNGWVLLANLPTSSAGLPAGALWNNAGVINMV